MPNRPFQVVRAPLRLSTTMLLAMLAYGAEPAPPPIPPHPLVAAAEALYQRKLPQACDDLMAQASMASGLTDDDLVRLQFLTALRALDDRDDLAARRAVSRALRIDPAAAPAPFASSLNKLVKDARAPLLPASPEDKSSRLAAARKAASEREPASTALLRAVDALYGTLQIEGASVVLDLAQASAAPIRTKVALRQGILRMEMADEAGARAAFKEALEADQNAVLPDFAPPKTLQVFKETKRAVTAAAPKVERAAAGRANASPHDDPAPFLASSREWGLAVGGTGLALVAGGAAAGVLALTSYQAEEKASKDGDYGMYTQQRDASSTARNAADGLYAAGALALGVGAFLFLTEPEGWFAGVGAGSGRASVAVGGHF